MELYELILASPPLCRNDKTKYLNLGNICSGLVNWINYFFTSIIMNEAYTILMRNVL